MLPFGGSFDAANPVLATLISNVYMYVRDAVIEFDEEYCKKKKKQKVDT
jgi:hypothetical protein